MFDITQYTETGFSVIEHVPRFSPARFDRLHVVLDADDGICESIGFPLCQAGNAVALQCNSDQAPNTINDFHRPCLIQHQQACFDAANQ